MMYVNIILYLVQENTCNYIDVPKNAGLAFRRKPLTFTVSNYYQNIWITHLNLL